ncbi:MAG: aminotransferase class V-fold PLP-dependent enzyme [Bacteroidota bacterium]
MNIEKIRGDIADYGNKLFLNSAGSSLMSDQVVVKIEQYLRQEERMGGYAVVESREKDITDFYHQAAKIIGANPKNIAFTHDATDAYIKALSAIDFKNGDIIITTDDDYSSNHIQFISLQKRFGTKTKKIRTLPNGDLDISHFEELLTKFPPKLVAVTQVPTNSGLIQNVEAIGRICEEQEILFLVDACQSVGQLNVDVKKLKCDFLTTTGRKFLRGPRGTGFLYVSEKVLNNGYYPLFIDGGGATWTQTEQFEILQTAKRYETWEKPYALLVGFSEALRYANEVGIDKIQTYNKKIMTRLRDNLMSLSEINLFDKGSKTCNILTFRKEGKSLEEVKKILDSNNVLFSVSQKEWGIIDYDKKGINGTIRLSPHYFNTMEEMDQVSEIIQRI